MKELLIVRHAKSSWEITQPDDFKRTLNERGHRDAPAMAKKMLDRSILIDCIVSSTAVRALTTANYFAEAYKIKEADFLQFKKLYHAAPKAFVEVIQALPNQYNCAAVFAHNPGITTFVNQLTETQIDDMPTCGVFAVKLFTSNWSELMKCKKEFLFFSSPKQGDSLS
jgi:phosphohistidine phosphatase